MWNMSPFGRVPLSEEKLYCHWPCCFRSVTSWEFWSHGCLNTTSKQQYIASEITRKKSQHRWKYFFTPWGKKKKKSRWTQSFWCFFYLKGRSKVNQINFVITQRHQHLLSQFDIGPPSIHQRRVQKYIT